MGICRSLQRHVWGTPAVGHGAVELKSAWISGVLRRRGARLQRIWKHIESGGNSVKWRKAPTIAEFKDSESDDGIILCRTGLICRKVEYVREVVLLVEPVIQLPNMDAEK